MLKRFNVDWKKLEEILGEDVSENFTSVMEKLKPQLPGKEDQVKKNIFENPSILFFEPDSYISLAIFRENYFVRYHVCEEKVLY